MAHNQQCFRKRGETWHLDCYIHGTRVRRSLGTGNLAEAKEKRDKFLREGPGSVMDQPEDVPLDTLMKLQEMRGGQHLAGSTLTNRRKAMSHFRAVFPALENSRDVLRRHIEEFKIHFVAVPSTINLYVTVLGSIFLWGVEHGVLEHNPCKGVKPLCIKAICESDRFHAQRQTILYVLVL